MSERLVNTRPPQAGFPSTMRKSIRRYAFCLALVPTLAAQSTPSACDLNGDGAVNVADVQIAINQVLGMVSCTMNLDGTGVCDVTDVQRVIAAALGGACNSSAPTSTTVSLPIEVAGPAGTTASTSFSVPEP